jgi:predicted  nucleic acid-binding Zn-ribbon protein
MDSNLQRLYELQGLDSRIAGLERKLEAIPVRIQALHDADEQARSALEAQRGKLAGVRKDLRSREKDLEQNASEKAKRDAKLYEVKTNKEYSAVLAEIESPGRGRIEEETGPGAQERMTREIGEAEGRLKRQEQESKAQEGAATEELRALETDLAVVRAERESLARDIPRDLLTQYNRLLKGRGGLAVAVVSANGICSGCRLPPQRLNELRQSARSHLRGLRPIPHIVVSPPAPPSPPR